MWKSQTETLSTVADDRDASTTLRAIIRERIEDGSLPLLAGTIVLLRVVLKDRSLPRVAGEVTVGGGLVVLGIRKRRSTEATTHEADNDKQFSSRQSTEGETDVDRKAKTGDEKRRSEEDDEESVSGDPRLSDDDSTAVDLSDSATAAEESEAVGPSPQQAEPTQTKDTEPETIPESDNGDPDRDDIHSGDSDGKEDNDDTATDR